MVNPLNQHIDFITRANSMYQPLNPQAGHFIVGNKGVEFSTTNGQKYIQIPWHSIKRIHVQLLFRGRFVRGFFIETDEGDLLEFIVSKGKECLRWMYRYLDRDHFTVRNSNFKSLFHRNK